MSYMDMIRHIVLEDSSEVVSDNSCTSRNLAEYWYNDELLMTGLPDALKNEFVDEGPINASRGE